jgi:hypothetical protein
MDHPAHAAGYRTSIFPAAGNFERIPDRALYGVGALFPEKGRRQHCAVGERGPNSLSEGISEGILKKHGSRAEWRGFLLPVREFLREL